MSSSRGRSFSAFDLSSFTKVCKIALNARQHLLAILEYRGLQGYSFLIGLLLRKIAINSIEYPLKLSACYYFPFYDMNTSQPAEYLIEYGLMYRSKYRSEFIGIAFNERLTCKPYGDKPVSVYPGRLEANKQPTAGCRKLAQQILIG